MLVLLRVRKDTGSVKVTLISVGLSSVIGCRVFDDVSSIVLNSMDASPLDDGDSNDTGMDEDDVNNFNGMGLFSSDMDTSELVTGTDELLDGNNLNGVECLTTDESIESNDDGWVSDDVTSPDVDVEFTDKRVNSSWYDLSVFFCFLYKYLPNSINPITPTTVITKTVILIKVTVKKMIHEYYMK